MAARKLRAMSLLRACMFAVGDDFGCSRVNAAHAVVRLSQGKRDSPFDMRVLRDESKSREKGGLSYVFQAS